MVLLIVGTQVTKLVVSFADIPGIRDKLPQMAQQLDVCQRALSDFLEDKRSSFPRSGQNMSMAVLVIRAPLMLLHGVKYTHISS